MNIQSAIKEDGIYIYSVELKIIYCIYGQLVEISQDTIETVSPTLSILDKEKNNNDAVVIELTSLDEITTLIKNFKKKFKKLTK